PEKGPQPFLPELNPTCSCPRTRQKRPTTMSKKAAKKLASKQRGEAVQSASVQPPPVVGLAFQRPVSGWRKWVARLALMVLVPISLLVVLELVLRLLGCGYPTSFFLKTDDGLHYTPNRSFGWQYFPRETATAPHPFLMPVE